MHLDVENKRARKLGPIFLPNNHELLMQKAMNMAG
jgi:hypothetical protein